jgi:Cdc6-like AAA superfamily ATPase
MPSTYIKRLHDEMLVGLFRAMRKGNFLLVGPRGNGKTAALMHFSDLLIDSGVEFSMIPGPRRESRFVPPFAKINLIDDIHLQLSRELVEEIERSRSSALNVMTGLHPVSLTAA